MKKFFKKICRFIVSFLAIFAILFTMSVIVFTVVSQYMYEDVSFIRELIIIAGICAAMSIIIVLFLQINNISPLFQTMIIYCFVFLVVFAMGYILYIYDIYNNARLFISTIIFFIIGLLCIIVIQMIVSKKSDDSLNADLKQFKERDK